MMMTFNQLREGGSMVRLPQPLQAISYNKIKNNYK